jgi:hypothetical protein
MSVGLINFFYQAQPEQDLIAWHECPFSRPNTKPDWLIQGSNQQKDHKWTFGPVSSCNRPIALLTIRVEPGRTFFPIRLPDQRPIRRAVDCLVRITPPSALPLGSKTDMQLARLNRVHPEIEVFWTLQATVYRQSLGLRH